LPASTFKDDLRDLINKHSLEGASGTPDFVLADYLVGCLRVYNYASQACDHFYRNEAKPGDFRDQAGIAADGGEVQLRASSRMSLDDAACLKNTRALIDKLHGSCTGLKDGTIGMDDCCCLFGQIQKALNVPPVLATTEVSFDAIPEIPDLKVETKWVPLCNSPMEAYANAAEENIDKQTVIEEARKLVNRLYSDLCYQAPEQWSSEVVRENITDTLEALKKLLGCETE
jgi:hypothetical protein